MVKSNIKKKFTKKEQAIHCWKLVPDPQNWIKLRFGGCLKGIEYGLNLYRIKTNISFLKQPQKTLAFSNSCVTSLNGRNIIIFITTLELIRNCWKCLFILKMPPIVPYGSDVIAVIISAKNTFFSNAIFLIVY